MKIQVWMIGNQIGISLNKNMIVGDGNIAKVLKDREGFLFFASGVSNSRCEDESEYKREENLLLAQDQSKHIVYFSSLTIFSLNTRYLEHKRRMEKIVKNYFRHYTIIRIGNIEWDDNPNTLINYLRNQKKEGKPLDIQDTYRYVVDKDEFLYWINLIPEWDCEMSIPGKRLKVSEIVEKYVNKGIT